MQSHNIIYHGHSFSGLDLQRHIMVDVVKSSIEDKQSFTLALSSKHKNQQDMNLKIYSYPNVSKNL
jgi:hypothetical protein